MHVYYILSNDLKKLFYKEIMLNLGKNKIIFALLNKAYQLKIQKKKNSKLKCYLVKFSRHCVDSWSMDNLKYF